MFDTAQIFDRTAELMFEHFIVAKLQRAEVKFHITYSNAVCFNPENLKSQNCLPLVFPSMVAKI